jgi:hypothetical protein
LRKALRNQGFFHFWRRQSSVAYPLTIGHDSEKEKYRGAWVKAVPGRDKPVAGDRHGATSAFGGTSHWTAHGQARHHSAVVCATAHGLGRGGAV